MTDGSFPPSPGFPPVPPAGAYPPPPAPPAPPKSRRGWFIGCGVGCLVLLLVLAVGGWFAWSSLRSAVQAMAGSSQTSFQQSTAPDGARTLRLERPAGGIQPIYYRVTVTTLATGASCTAASAVGLQAERYVHPIWTGPTAILVRYGTFQSGNGSGNEVTAASGSGACTDVTVTLTHDPLLDAEATAANSGAPATGSSTGGATGGKDGRIEVPPPIDTPPAGGDNPPPDGGQGGDLPPGKP